MLCRSIRFLSVGIFTKKCEADNVFTDWQIRQRIICESFAIEQKRVFLDLNTIDLKIYLISENGSSIFCAFFNYGVMPLKFDIVVDFELKLNLHSINP